MSLKSHICVMNTRMNISGGLRMCNFQLRCYASSKLPARHTALQ